MSETELPLAQPHGPLQLIEDDDALLRVIDLLAAGTGPVAVDVERASGYRYSQRAYLVQLFRRGSGSFLIDPISAGGFDAVQETIGDTEWVLHAASQDLPSLRELGLEPTTLFDTELGARLAGFERVGLQAVVERTLGLRLKKEHSNSDWSVRPLPAAWLEYAALDVELLIDVRDAVADELQAQGKEDLAREEFDYELRRPSKPPAAEPWRRLSGVHRIKQRRSLAVARELWLARDTLARELDAAPGRLVPDASLVAAAEASPSSKGELGRLKEFNGRRAKTELDRWWDAVQRGQSSEDLPRLRPLAEGPPPPRFWEQKRPTAAARLKAARAALTEKSEEVRIPQENLLTPDTLRRTIWDADDARPLDIAESLLDHGARRWQVETAGRVVQQAVQEADASVVDSVQAKSKRSERAS